MSQGPANRRPLPFPVCGADDGGNGCESERALTGRAIILLKLSGARGGAGWSWPGDPGRAAVGPFLFRAVAPHARHCIVAPTRQHPSLHRHSHAPTPVTAPPLPFAKHICSTADALIGTALGACYLIPCALSASIRAFFAAAMTRLNLFVRAPHPRQAVGPHHPRCPCDQSGCQRRKEKENGEPPRMQIKRPSGRAIPPLRPKLSERLLRLPHVIR